MDAKEGEYGLSEMDIGERAVLRSQIQNLLSLEEVLWRQKLRVLCIKEGDKASGPDGFSMAFYRHCWGVVKRDVLAVFEEFY